MRNSMCLADVYVPDEIKQRREKKSEEADDTEPHVDERALVLVRRRGADAEDEGQAAENVGEKIDHVRVGGGAKRVRRNRNVARPGKLLWRRAVYYDAELHRIDAENERGGTHNFAE
jgi:hypothetical protein